MLASIMIHNARTDNELSYGDEKGWMRAAALLNQLMTSVSAKLYFFIDIGQRLLTLFVFG
jgi:hypothetical protein